MAKTNNKKTQKTATKKSSVTAKAAAKKPVRKAVVKVVAKAKKAKMVTKIAARKAAPKKVVSVKKSPQKALKKVVAAKKAPQKPIATKTKAVAPVAAKTVAKPAAKVPAAAPQTAKDSKAFYKVGNFVVYPTHGVGKILAEETQTIGDVELRLLVINFDRDKMTLRVPMHRATAAGLRPVSGADKIKEMYVTLKSKAKISRGMWSRRAQEYETKINSGNILLISEVVRDLHQNVDQSERSYSERMIYENALNRLVGEVAAAEGTEVKAAYDKLMKLLRAKVAAAAALKEAA